MSGEGLSLKSIVRRFERNGRIIRELDCGHEQVQSSGGRAALATHAYCSVCNSKPAAQVIGTCTAIVMPLNAGKVRPCGKPAKHLKRGQPRCGFHNARGAR